MKSIGWVDLTIADAAEVRDFYGKVMGWRPEGVPMGEYDDFNMVSPATGEPAAGICHARGANAGIPPVWMVYFFVDDLALSAGQVEASGGKLLQPPRSAGGTSYVVAQDPSGAVFAMVERRDDDATGT